MLARRALWSMMFSEVRFSGVSFRKRNVRFYGGGACVGWGPLGSPRGPLKGPGSCLPGAFCGSGIAINTLGGLKTRSLDTQPPGTPKVCRNPNQDRREGSTQMPTRGCDGEGVLFSRAGMGCGAIPASQPPSLSSGPSRILGRKAAATSSQVWAAGPGAFVIPGEQ